MQFVPAQDFEDAELGSCYVAGLVYTVRTGNDLLACKVSEWASEGRVRLLAGTETQPDAKLQGAGIVE